MVRWPVEEVELEGLFYLPEVLVVVVLVLVPFILLY
jgi:hypothetical protein